jgi:hypothetical protein
MNSLLRVLVVSAFAGVAAAQGPCSSTVVGTGCGGVLDITFTAQGNAGNQRIDVAASNLQPNTIGVMAWGYQPANISLGGGCSLLVDFAWGHLIQLDAQGAWNWSRVWPASAMPGSYYIQLGSLVFDNSGGFTAVVTDSKLAQCN